MFIYGPTGNGPTGNEVNLTEQTEIMILSDNSIRHACEVQSLVKPFDPSLIQPASIDIRLGGNFRWLKRYYYSVKEIDLAKLPDSIYLYDSITKSTGETFTINPHEFVLGCTVETFKIPGNIQATVCGKSSIGRLGLFVENAGFIDPGFEGELTLELYNACSLPIVLTVGQRIAQVSFQELNHSAQYPYGSSPLGSHYHGQTGATASRFELK